MKVDKREARVLKEKAIASLKIACVAFNSLEESGRQTTVLLHLQHAFEMLLKAGLIKVGISIFPSDGGNTFGFEKCLNLSSQHLGLTADECGTLRTIDEWRDAEQHFRVDVIEGFLHFHCQACVTLFDGVLVAQFDETLADHLPDRVLPLSTQSIHNIQTLIDREFSQIHSMLQPGRRQGAEARSRIRGLLALGSHTESEDYRVTEEAVATAERTVRAGGSKEDVLPSIGRIELDIVGSIETLPRVRFVKSDSALGVRFAVDDEEAVALREVDLHSTFHLGRSQLAARLEITTAKCCALRWKSEIESDPRAYRSWTHGDRRVEGFSGQAVVLLREFMAGVDLNEVFREYKRRSPMNIESTAAD